MTKSCANMRQSRQYLTLRGDEVHHLELSVAAGVLGQEAIVPAHHGCHGTQEVGTDELKPLRDLSLVRLVVN